MKYGVEYSKVAIRDLDNIWTEVLGASKDYDITQKYLEDLMDKVKAKAIHPKSGSPLYYEDAFTGYYFIVFKAYIIFYRIENNNILVDRVLFAASDYIKHLNLETE